ncbi:MAG TPA: type II toxin-antitoxin system VapC family toxin [Longimicrobium sp.]
MRLLLDTHALWWFLEGNPRLSQSAREAIEDPANERLFSTAGAWEIAIKVSLGKLALHVPYEHLVPGQLLANDIALLPLRPEHLAGVLSLPSITAIPSTECSSRRRSPKKRSWSART